MSILDRIGNVFKRKQEKRSVVGTTTLTYANYSTISEQTALLLSVVYRCVDLIGNSVAQLPIDIYDSNKNKISNELGYILNVEPNAVLSRFTFIKLMISSMLLRGEAFAVIDRDINDNIIGLHYVDSSEVGKKVTTDGVKRSVYYVINGKAYESINIIHLLNYSYDGINGISTIRSAINSIKLAGDAEAAAQGFYNGGCNLGGILTIQGMLDEDQKYNLKQQWQNAFNPVNGTPNGVAVLEGNMSYTPITVNPADAQLLESRKYNVVDICRFFGVSPTKAFDLTHSSYSTVEAEGLQFLSDTIQPILSKIEQELNRKLLKPSERHLLSIKFDTSVLLRTDKASLASYYSTLFNIGVLSQNEIRQNLDLTPIENGNKHFVQVNMSSNIGEEDNGEEKQ